MAFRSQSKIGRRPALIAGAAVVALLSGPEPAAAQRFTPEEALFRAFEAVCIGALPDFQRFPQTAAAMGLRRLAPGLYERPGTGVSVSIAQAGERCQCAMLSGIPYSDAAPEAAEAGLQDLARRTGATVERVSSAAAIAGATRLWRMEVLGAGFIVASSNQRGVQSLVIGSGLRCATETMR